MFKNKFWDTWELHLHLSLLLVTCHCSVVEHLQAVKRILFEAKNQSENVLDNGLSTYRMGQMSRDFVTTNNQWTRIRGLVF